MLYFFIKWLINSYIIIRQLGQLAAMTTHPNYCSGHLAAYTKLPFLVFMQRVVFSTSLLWPTGTNPRNVNLKVVLDLYVKQIDKLNIVYVHKH